MVQVLGVGREMLRFEIDNEKLVNAMAYIAERVPGATKMVISKILYFADKEHLLKYGRPITGDSYSRLEHGPVPSVGLRMMRGRASARQMLAYQSKLQTLPSHAIRAISSPDLNFFSRSDVRELDEAVAKYGHMSAGKLRKLSHDEPTWLKTPENEMIPFELMFEGRPDATLTLELLRGEFCEREPETISV
jgi:uncharacterized phage-associated protein